MFVGSLVAETKKEGLVDVTQAYNKIINSIKEAEEAANMAGKAANDTMEVQDARSCFHLYEHIKVHNLKLRKQLALNYLFVCVRVEHKGPEPRSDR